MEEIKQSGFFDGEWYLEQYPDVRSNKMDPALHFMNHGWQENRDPSTLFNTKWYVETYPDACANGLNPLLHYIRHGLREGRPGRDSRVATSAEFVLPPSFLDFIAAETVTELIEQARQPGKYPDPFVAYSLMMQN